MNQEGFNQLAYDVAVIGSGSAGLAAAYALAAARQKVALIERDNFLGGECPNYACVPAKTLLRTAKLYKLIKNARNFGIKINEPVFDYRLVKAHKDDTVSKTGGRNLDAKQLADRGITLIRGQASFIDQHTLRVGNFTISARQFVIATGSSTNIPAIDGLASTPYLVSKTAMDLVELPESIIILGAGPVGVEFAQLFSSFGADVTLLAHDEQILSREDQDIADKIAQNLKANGVTIVTSFKTEKITGDQSLVTVFGGSPLGQDEFSANKILIATGQKPNTSMLNLEKIGVRVTSNGIKTDEWLRTNVPHIWAAGDVRGEVMFTHTSHYEGSLVAKNILGQESQLVDLSIVPKVIFTDPEVASVGITEKQARQDGKSTVIGTADIAVLGRALTDGETDGIVKIVVDPNNGLIMGAAIIAERAGEMIHELALAMKANVSVGVIANTIHAFPTYSEAIVIACADAASKLETHQIIPLSNRPYATYISNKTYYLINWQ